MIGDHEGEAHEGSALWWAAGSLAYRSGMAGMRVASRSALGESSVMAGDASRGAAMADEDVDWVEGLTATGPERERTVARLYLSLLAPARAEAGRLGRTLAVRGPEIDDIACQATGDAVVSILRKLPEFRGEARFTTWAYRFVLNEVATKVNRHFWRRSAISLDATEWCEVPATRDFQPEIVVEYRDMLAAVTRAVITTLTEKQRTALLATALDGTSPAALGRQRGADRNAVYKMVFDARRKLRSVLVVEGYIGTAGGSKSSGGTRRREFPDGPVRAVDTAVPRVFLPCGAGDGS